MRMRKLSGIYGSILLGCLPLAGLPLGPALAPAAEAKPRADPKDQTRPIWSRREAGFLRTWLVCGPFPSAARPRADRLAGDPSGQGFDRDDLKGLGGEKARSFAAGQSVKGPDGAVRTWRAYTSDQDVVDFRKAFPGGESENVVAYAFATVRRKAAGPAVLALGSDDSVKVYVNGKLVHSHKASRGVNKDEDLVPVDLARGDNAVLVKVDNGRAGWGLAARVLSKSQWEALPVGEIRPAILPARPGAEGVLSVQTDTAPPRGAAAGEVRVQAILAGGKVLGQAKAARGEPVEFKTAAWPEGPYEIRVSTTTPPGEPVFRHLPWYKGNWRAEAIRLLIACDDLPARPTRPDQIRLRMLGQMVVDRLDGDPRNVSAAKPSPVGWEPVHPALMEYAETLAGERAVLGPHGFLRLAWRDEIDDSPQFARAYLPPDYDPGSKKRWPLVVILHGYNPANPPYVKWWGVTGRHNALAERHGVIVVEPHGRGNTGYLGMGDADVMTAVRQAKATFRVDDDRVYLTGYSMGGGGTWHVGTRHVGTFAAIAPVYGGWDYHVELDAKAFAALTPLRRFLQERASSFAQAECLLATPVWVHHGGADELVDVEHSRYAVRLLQRWGYNIRYQEHPGLGHTRLGHEDELVTWFLRHKLDRAPRRVRLRSAELRHAQAHWVRVLQGENPFAFLLAEAHAADPHTIRLDTENVLAVHLAPPDGLVEYGRDVRVIWNGEPAGTFRFTPAGVTLRAKGYTPGPHVKTPVLPGPIDDVTNTPFAIVIGTTAKDPRMRRFIRLRAEAAREEWIEWQKVAPRTFLDTEITDQQVRAYSLKLFGGPDDNKVARALAKDLPLQLAPGKVTLGDRTFTAPDAAVSAVYPHPRNPKRYVQVIAGTSPAGMFFANRLPGDADYAIADARGAGDEVPFQDVCIAWGCFDCNWRFDEKYLRTGKPEVRAKAPLLKAPQHLRAADVKGKRLMLSELLETRSVGSFARMKRDRNWQGKALTLGGKAYASGIGVAVWHEPCSASYDLAGGGWKRLRARIGIEIADPAKLEDKQKAGTRVFFVVRGDGKELYRSPTFGWDTGPADLDVNVADVKRLQLQVANEVTWHCAASSVNWCDLRLEK